MPSRGEVGRRVRTVLFTDIVSSTHRAVQLGDQQWQALLESHDQMVRAAIAGFAGIVIGTAGDGFGAAFESPRAAIACAQQALSSARDLELQLRAGLHTGEVELRSGTAAGIGVHIAARIAAIAEPDEVLVSATVKDLLTGSGVVFVARGTHALKGVPGRRSLFAVDSIVARDDSDIPGRPAAGSSEGRGSRAVPPALRLVVVDDHPLWRETLAGLLEGSGEAVVVGQAGNGEDAVALAAAEQPDVLLIDVDMPKMNGIEAARQIAAARPGAKVLMLSSVSDRDEVLGAVRAGASGYLLKTAEADDILDAVRRVHAGEMAFPSALTPLVLEALRGAEPAQEDSSGLGSLSAQESTVLEHVADGHSNTAIAQAMHLSVKTVEAHLASIFTKLGLESSAAKHRRVQAATLYLTARRAPRGGRDNP